MDYFTWDNHHFDNGNVKGRLDLAVITDDWLNLYPWWGISYLVFSYSNLSPILVKFDNEISNLRDMSIIAKTFLFWLVLDTRARFSRGYSCRMGTSRNGSTMGHVIRKLDTIVPLYKSEVYGILEPLSDSWHRTCIVQGFNCKKDL